MTPDALAALHRVAFSHDPWSASDFVAFLDDPASVLVANDKGFVLLRCVLDEAEVLTFAVAPASQGRGVGAALLAEALTKVRVRGVTRVFLEVAADNKSARALYARAGFVQTGLRKDYYRRTHGPAVDALLLERALA